MVSHKRCLDDDNEVYAAKKQQILRQIRREIAGTEITFMKQHAQGSMSILNMLSTGNTPSATLQLLQTIRHNITARLGRMTDSGMQGMLAIEAAPLQLDFGCNHSKRLTQANLFGQQDCITHIKFVCSSPN